MSEIIPMEIINQKIFLIRREKVMFDMDLAKLYGVETKHLIQAVKRNISRFPPDFMFQLSDEEFTNLRSQNVTSSWVVGVIHPMFLLNMGLLCFHLFLKANVP